MPEVGERLSEAAFYEPGGAMSINAGAKPA
jgi:hypothetical protein